MRGISVPGGEPRRATRSRWALVLVAAALACAVLSPARALGAVGDLSFTGCFGKLSLSGCTATGSDTTAIDGPASVATSADGRSLYVASNTSNAIAEFSRDPSTGAVSYLGCIGASPCTNTSAFPNPDSPQGVAVSPDGTSVYVASDVHGAINEFSRNPFTGALTYTGCLGEPAACAHVSSDFPDAISEPESITVSPNSASVYVGTVDELDVLARNPSTGALTFSSCNGSSTGCAAPPAPLPNNALTDLLSVAVSPDGTSVYAPGANSKAVFEFSRTPTTGALTFTGCIGNETGCTAPATTMQFPTSVAVSPDRSSVYVSAETTNTVYEFSRDSTGALTLTGCIGNQTGCAATVPSVALQGVEAVAVSPDGSNVYAGGPNGLSALSRDAATGLLSLTACFGGNPCTTTTPSDAAEGTRAIAVSPDGAGVYGVSNGENVLDAFSRVIPPLACANVGGGVEFATPTTIGLSCSDPEHVPLTYSIVSAPGHGTLGPVSSSGQVTYTPAAGYSGADSFTYRAGDAQESSNVATATLNVAPKPPPPLPPSQTHSVTIGNQKITLTSPSLLVCTTHGKKLAVKLGSQAIRGSKAKKLKFSAAVVYLDKGIKHTHKKHERTKSGKRKTVTITTYSANATAHHIPTTDEVSIGSLRAGTHTLKVRLSYKGTGRKRGHKITVITTKTLTAKFKVC